jgi:hypothetical protein
METVSGELTDFCLVLAPDGNAVETAGEALRSRFSFLDEPIRMQLVDAVARRVRHLVERGTGRPIAVMIAVEPDAIHGAVTDQDVSENGTKPGFEIPLGESGRLRSGSLG